MRSFEIEVVSGQSTQTNKNIDKRVCNAVTLVWGSLRLVPITTNTCNLQYDVLTYNVYTQVRT